MEVLFINGSPKEKGCTFTALSEVASELEKAGIATSFFHIGKKNISGCIGCGACAKSGYCIFTDDPVNECVDRLKKADGVVIGSPVYYAGPNATLCALLDRVFFMKSGPYRLKPGAAIVNCRRGGASAAFDRLNKYFTIAEMPVVSSQYWNSTHGFTPDDVRKDLEGLQTMRVLGRNMAWLLKCIEAGKGTVPMPEIEPRAMTNFVD